MAVFVGESNFGIVRDGALRVLRRIIPIASCPDSAFSLTKISRGKRKYCMNG
jgi:hypothetical protein